MCPDDERRNVPGVDERQRPGVVVEHSIEERGVLITFRRRIEEAVDLDCPRRDVSAAARGERLDAGLEARHQQGGIDPLARHVANRLYPR